MVISSVSAQVIYFFNYIRVTILMIVLLWSNHQISGKLKVQNVKKREISDYSSAIAWIKTFKPGSKHRQFPSYVSKVFPLRFSILEKYMKSFDPGSKPGSKEMMYFSEIQKQLTNTFDNRSGNLWCFDPGLKVQ